jgi:release factor glutamine methyltransferase
MQPAHPVDPATVAFLRAAGCVYAEEEARILTDAATAARPLGLLLERRAAGEPLEYIVGWAGFCGLRICVRPGVFVPRRRSEFLAECAVDVVNAVRARSEVPSGTTRVLDMCCGTGAIGLAVATRSCGVELFAADDSSLAVECARENLAAVQGEVHQGDLFDALPQAVRNGFDVIVASPPYVPSSRIARLPAEARAYEPLSTLDGGPDGTDVQRRILESAGAWLRTPGFVVMESGPDVANTIARIGRDNGFTAEIRRDGERDATVLIAGRE